MSGPATHVGRRCLLNAPLSGSPLKGREGRGLDLLVMARSVIDPQRFREVMGSFPSGVVVLTAFGEDGLPRGLTVSAFCAVSLEPPLALVCIDKFSHTLPAVQHTGGFTANILAAGREQLARSMATK